MPYEPAPNTGSFWATPKTKISKTTGKTYNSYSGSCFIDGKEYWINGLLKETKAGPVYDLRFNPKNAPQENEIPLSNIPF